MKMCEIKLEHLLYLFEIKNKENLFYVIVNILNKNGILLYYVISQPYTCVWIDSPVNWPAAPLVLVLVEQEKGLSTTVG